MSLTAQYPSVYPRFDIKENVKFIKDDGTVVYLNNVEGDTVVEFELIQKKVIFSKLKPMCIFFQIVLALAPVLFQTQSILLHS